MVAMLRRFLPVLFLFCFINGCDRGGHPAMVGRDAPDFSIRDGSRTVTLSHLRGKPVLLNFWASWCAPCLEEIPAMQELHRELPGLQILAVATDTDQAAYASYMQAHPLSFDNVLDPGQQACRAYPTTGVPETYVIDSQGKIVRKFIGPQDWTSPAIVNYLKSL